MTPLVGDLLKLSHYRWINSLDPQESGGA